MPADFTLTATADTLESRIRANRLFDLPAPWADEIIFPYYNGLSLANVSQTIARLLGLDVPSAALLDAAVWGGSLPDIDRVVLFLSDGLGYLWLKQAMADDPEIAALTGDLSDGRGPLPLTSIAPSTTVAALTTLWTGLNPAAHGMLGTRLYLREFAMLSNLLGYKPLNGSHPDGVFAAWGHAPETFVPVAGFGERLAGAGIATHLLLPKNLMGSGLSKILHRGIQHRHVHVGYSDLWLRLEDVLRATAGQRVYVSVYWPAVDSVAHAYGAYNRYLRNEIKYQLTRLRQTLDEPTLRDGRTLVLILADHGHSDVPREINLAQDEPARPIFDALRVGYGGENRLPFLYLRGGAPAAVVERLENAYADRLTWVESGAALAAGLFGTETPYAETPHRLGELVLIPRLGWQVSDNFARLDFLSMHGGLSDQEMLVPLLWKRL
ncbi:MAG: alkaline phosphatase family protein [Chloroflexi bacterium]|nr:alkaline phosphatase family protein [Chloroflexota bacterium]